MQKKYTIISFIILSIALGSLSSFVNAHTNANDWWLCTHEPHELPSGRLCDASCCIVCISKDPLNDCLSFPGRPRCSCNFDKETNDTQAPYINILEPTQGSTLNSKTAKLHIVLNEKAKLELSVNGGDFKRLCSDCGLYDGKRVFVEGFNTVQIKATDESNNMAIAPLSFTVDSKKPAITAVTPSSGYANGDFEVKYTEANVKTITVYIKGSADSDFIPHALSSCPSGAKVSCSIHLDISAYEGQQIQHYFTVSDGANNVNSKTKKVSVDSTAPLLTINAPLDGFYNEKKLLWDVTSNEPVKITYADNGEKSKIFCSKCNGAQKFVTLNDGNHLIEVTAVDAAGLISSKIMSLLIDTQKPKIFSVTPKKGTMTNGQFSINYAEDDLQSMTLYIKGPLDADFIAFPIDCPSGKKASCSTTINLASYEGQQIEYYISLADRTATVASLKIKVTVDTTTPILLIKEPAEATYQTKSIPLELQANEKVAEMLFSDNGNNFKKLCSNCNTYKAKKTFSIGDHSVVFAAHDKAGNEIFQAVSFTVE